jgi:hypothetical protein
VKVIDAIVVEIKVETAVNLGIDRSVDDLCLHLGCAAGHARPPPWLRRLGAVCPSDDSAFAGCVAWWTKLQPYKIVQSFVVPPSLLSYSSRWVRTLKPW